ncbi:MAG: hypothetical protein LBV43_04270 [Prevotella sp.]|nr:hypothetical protein [Prevotella sp.]
MVYFVRRENWIKLIIFLCGISLPYVLSAQVAIGALDAPHSSAVLELITEERGFLGPQVALKDIWDKETVPNYTDGLLVLNMND